MLNIDCIEGPGVYKLAISDGKSTITADLLNNTAVYDIRAALDVEWHHVAGVPRAVIGVNNPNWSELTQAPLWIYTLLDFCPPLDHSYVLHKLLRYAMPDYILGTERALRYAISQTDIHVLQTTYNTKVDNNLVRRMQEDYNSYLRLGLPVDPVVNRCPFRQYEELQYYDEMSDVWQMLTIAQRALLFYKAIGILPSVIIR